MIKLRGIGDVTLCKEKVYAYMKILAQLVVRYKYVLLVLVILFLCRNVALRGVIDRRIAGAEKKYGLTVGYNKLHFSGLTKIGVLGFYVVPHDRDTLLTLGSLNVKVGFWSLFAGRIVVKDIMMDNLNVNFIKRDSVANYDFLFQVSGRKKDTLVVQHADFAGSVNRVLNLAYGFLPQNGRISNLVVKERKDSNFVTVSVPALTIAQGRFNDELFINEDGRTQELRTQGELNNDDDKLDVRLFSVNGKSVELPYVNRRFGAMISFDTLSCRLVKTKEGGGVLGLSGGARVSGFTIAHKDVSVQPVTFRQGGIFYKVRVGENFVELDSTSRVVFNKLEFNPYLRGEKNAGEWHITTSLNKGWFEASDLFESLPTELFGNLEGVRAEGELSCNFFADLDMASLDSLKFEMDVRQRDFKLSGNGLGELLKLNGEFIYTAYEKGEPVSEFAVGSSYRYFTPLDSISAVLRMSVLQSEDGEFFYHNGFRPDALREAIIYDIKERRFARGGSTISMQLIKNVYLNRRKNFARKAEEALLVWLIESRRLVSKQRMFEVYLNIIEWGPGIYGIGEASRFYFDKLPSQLTVEESIFLASIIPKPKYYMNSFDQTGQLKENLQGYFNSIAQRLAKKELITQAQADTIRPRVVLKIREQY